MKTVHLSFEQAFELQLLLCREIRGVNNGIQLYRDDMNESTSAEVRQLSKELLESYAERGDKLKEILELVRVSPYGLDNEKE